MKMRLDNKGQSLITFVLILPLIALFIAFFIDSSLAIMEKSKLEGIINDNMKIAIDSNIRDAEEISKAIKKNSDVDLIISINEDVLKINAKSKKKNIFGNIIKLPYYNIEFNYCGSYIDKKIDKKCG